MIRFLAVALSILWCFAAQADERILDFHSNIDISTDGTMIVAETITVNAEHDRIIHGIYRDFPTDYRDASGNNVHIPFKPVDVTRDGKPESWYDEGLWNGVRVYFGDASTYLDRGQHTYVFRYQTTRQLGFFDDHDELYWNVSGNGWDFTMDSASAEVSLPGTTDAAQIKVEGYTGVQGSKAQNYTARVDEKGHAIISTTRALPPASGLTVVVSFPKGIVTVPDMKQKLYWFVDYNRRETVLALGLLILLGFLYTQWRRFGVDPKASVVIPEYDPPNGISPAAARYVQRMGYDDRCFAADIIDLGVRGAVKIIMPGRCDFSIERARPAGSDIPDSERLLYDALLLSSESLQFKSINHATIEAARTGHESLLKTTYAKANFQRNDGTHRLGILISIIAIVGAFLIDPPSVTWLVIASTIVTAIAAALLSKMIYIRLNGLPVDREPIRPLIVILVLVLAWGLLSMVSSVLFATLIALLAGVQVPFANWLPAPTVQGRKLLDRLEGLRLYLGVAERDDLARTNTPPMSVGEYERLLPYALALDVEKTWGDKLADAIGPAAVATATAGMAWYSGDRGADFNVGSFAGSLGASFSRAISSSAMAPGSSSGRSSSGSFGGASSGGGGGGGGGGGW